MRFEGWQLVFLALGGCIGAACAVTTEADVAPEEQRAYARCVDGCVSEPSEQTDSPSAQDQLRLCQKDCATSYPVNGAAPAPRRSRRGPLEGPETGGRDPTGVTIDTPPPPPPEPGTVNE